MGSSQSEADLRDYIAVNLDIIEPGLRLRATEYRLPSTLGASGSIDILAIDRFGVTVILELKKSDQTARQALHELHKYISLLKHNHGLTDSKLRCILLSTHWHELLVPFSEFVSTAPWVIEGYQLHLGSAGIPQRATRVTPVAHATSLQLSRPHYAIFFENQDLRDRAIEWFAVALRDQNVPDAIVMALDYKAKRYSHVHFALYSVIAEFSDSEREEARKNIAARGLASARSG